MHDAVSAYAVIISGIVLAAENIYRQDFDMKVDGFCYRNRSTVDCIRALQQPHCRYSHVKAQIVDFLEIGTRLGRGCDLAFGTFQIDIHYVASVAGKGAAYSCPGFLIDSLVRQDFHRKLRNCAGTHA